MDNVRLHFQLRKLNVSMVLVFSTSLMLGNRCELQMRAQSYASRSPLASTQVLDICLPRGMCTCTYARALRSNPHRLE